LGEFRGDWGLGKNAKGGKTKLKRGGHWGGKQPRGLQFTGKGSATWLERGKKILGESTRSKKSSETSGRVGRKEERSGREREEVRREMQ